MSKTDWRSEVRLTGDVDSGDDERARRRDRGDPFAIIVLADFAGDGGREPGTALRSFEIDIDTFEQVMTRCGVRWRGTLHGLPHGAVPVPVEIAFQSIDHFHPDHLVRQVAPLRALLETRHGLADPDRFERVAGQIASWAGVEPPQARSGQPRVAPLPLGDPSDLLNQILAEASQDPSPVPLRVDDFQRFVEHVVGPHLITIDRAHQAEYVALFDRLLSQQLRAVLHDPAFQRLEAAWRGLWWLIRRIGSTPEVSVQILPLARRNLAEAAADESRLASVLGDPRRPRPAIVLGDFDFGAATDDIATLGWLGRIAGGLQVPFIAAASPALLGRRSFVDLPTARELSAGLTAPTHDEWRALRRSPEAHWIVLALPRLLGRLPYGTRTEPIEAFGFEELESGAEHAALLWLGPAFGVAAVAAAAFAERGWELDIAREVQQIDALPLYVHDEGGTAVTQPCAEVLLSDTQIEALSAMGLLPVVSLRNRDTVALPCIQSIADPRRALAWTA